MNNPVNATLEKYIHVKLVRSRAGRLSRHRAILAATGLKRLNQVVKLRDNAATRGMLRLIHYLVRVEEK